MRGLVAVCLWAALVAACGTLGGEGSDAADRGLEALPSRGAAGFADEGEVVLARSEGAPAGSSVVRLPEGGYRLVHARLTDGCLAAATSADGRSWEPGAALLCPEEAWQGEALRDPCALVAKGAVRLWYGTADGAGIGAATWDPASGGVEARADPVATPVSGGVLRKPHVVEAPGGALWMYVEVGRGGGIARHVSADDGATWSLDPAGVVLAPACAPEAPAPACARPSPPFDADAVGDPFVRRVTSPLGRTLWDLWYVGREGGEAALGFAGSFDGVAWSRYRDNPVLPSGVRPASPWVVELDGGTALLLDSVDGITLRLRGR